MEKKIYLVWRKLAFGSWLMVSRTEDKEKAIEIYQQQERPAMITVIIQGVQDEFISGKS